MKTWKPDTCDCVVEEVYEGTDIIGMGEIINKCPAHTTVPDEDLYGVLYSNPDSEQKRKNLLYKEIVNSDLGEDSPNGRVLKEGITYDWLFKGEGVDRILEVTLGGATVKQKSDLGAVFNKVTIK